MFPYILKQLEDAESLLIELGATGSDLSAKIESIKHALDPDTANKLMEASHAVKLSPEFFSESDIDDLEAAIGQASNALNKYVLDKNTKELKEQLEKNNFPGPNMLERIKKIFVIDPLAQSRKMEPSKLILINLLKRYSLSCDRCNSLSAPILDTADRYRCVKCARQFISAKHHIRQVALDHFKKDFAAQRFILKYYDECIDRVSHQA
ncbi:hypothetical protein IFT47_16645 [Pseudomonas sp. CFBP 13711]|uniref:hypothetical protein n=1 Tax=unclassified Pseudomonas TaxID=196821 RepID=UPI001785EC89|nr:MULTISPECIES: hypothetical protein [unclassified Pseudomonas]MBD8708260.1 hypothetical protein [Pseudomonas sp. CFBP 13711]MBD8713500.1 hypothetical protein [Pseudomonas sp. CFBP 13715]